MASTSNQVSRYQPAVLAVAAAAAGYGVYLLLASWPQTANAVLHRSNAVHRPRRDRVRQSIDHIHSTPDSPLGTIIIRRGSRNIHINLATTPLPSIQDLQQVHHFADPQHMRHELVSAAISVVLTACFIASHHSDTSRQVEQCGLQKLLEVMAARDVDQIRLHAWDIPSILQMGDVEPEDIDLAVSNFLESPKWRAESEIGSEDGTDPAETEDLGVMNDGERGPSQGLRGLLYYIAEEDAKRKAYEHRGIQCEECGEQPIRGIRWHCLNCPNFDLCSACEQGSQHPKTHVFAKIKIPLPVLSQPTKGYQLWYPGDPQRIHKSLDAAMKKRLCQEHGFEEPQMDAFYDQFICLANIPNPSPAAVVEAALDRRAFNKAMTCEKWPLRFAANALYERMFCFYDINSDGIIDFEEFVSGLAYLRGPKRFASLARTIRGYDMDGDSFVERSDFMRLFRAKYDIQKQLVSDMIDGQETEQSQAALEVLRSSQPISSIFANEDIPPGETRRPRGKVLDSFGDMQPLEDTKTVLESEYSWPKLAARRSSVRRRTRPAHEQLRRHLSRFEELLHGQPTDQERAHLGSMDDDAEVPTMMDVDLDLDLIDMGSRADPFEDVNKNIQDSTDDVLAEEPHVQDLLWEIEQKGLNELLGAIFSRREHDDDEVADTSVERMRWRSEIDTAVEEEEARRNAAAADPLMATARALVVSEPNARLSQLQTPRLTLGDIVSTDWDSLERREQAIPETPLPDLLNLAGFGVRETEDDSSPRAAHLGSSSIWNGRRAGAASSPLSTVISSTDTTESADPTLPQNRPTDIPASKRSPSPRKTSGESMTSDPDDSRVPAKSRLLYLAMLDEIEREMQERGGPGRMSYEEVEYEVVHDSRGELRALVKGWLEWASF